MCREVYSAMTSHHALLHLKSSHELQKRHEYEQLQAVQQQPPAQLSKPLSNWSCDDHLIDWHSTPKTNLTNTKHQQPRLLLPVGIT